VRIITYNGKCHGLSDTSECNRMNRTDRLLHADRRDIARRQALLAAGLAHQVRYVEDRGVSIVLVRENGWSIGAVFLGVVVSGHMYLIRLGITWLKPRERR
jgi:hypothetical protein